MFEFGFGQIGVWATLIAGTLAGVILQAVPLSFKWKAVAVLLVIASTALITAPQALDICSKMPSVCGSAQGAVGGPRVDEAKASAPTVVHKVERIIERERIIEVPSASDARQRSVDTGGDTLRQVAMSTARPPAPPKADAFAPPPPPAEAKIVPRKPSPAPPAAPVPDPAHLLASEIKLELVRLNCLAPTTGPTWGREVVTAINKFNMRGYRRISDQPDAASLPILREFRDPVC